jgi:hypothetical protein
VPPRPYDSAIEGRKRKRRSLSPETGAALDPDENSPGAHQDSYIVTRLLVSGLFTTGKTGGYLPISTQGVSNW